MIPKFAAQMDRSQWPGAMEAKLTAGDQATKTRDEWSAIMEGTDVCFGPVLQWPKRRAIRTTSRAKRSLRSRAWCSPAPPPLLAHAGGSAGAPGKGRRRQQPKPCSPNGEFRLVASMISGAFSGGFNRAWCFIIPGSGRFSSLARTGARFSLHLRGETKAPAAGSAAGAIAFVRSETCMHSARECCAAAPPLRNKAHKEGAAWSTKSTRTQSPRSKARLRRHDGHERRLWPLRHSRKPHHRAAR
jgi:hypothetical protein